MVSWVLCFWVFQGAIKVQGPPSSQGSNWGEATSKFAHAAIDRIQFFISWNLPQFLVTRASSKAAYDMAIGFIRQSK